MVEDSNKSVSLSTLLRLTTEKKFGSKIKFTKSMIDDLNQPVCYPVTSIMNGLAIFKKSKFGHEFIFLTQYESTFILVTLPKKDPGEEDF